MIILFEVMKWLFFFFSIVAVLIVARGHILFGPHIAQLATMIVVPWYLVLSGVMMGYVVMKLRKKSHEDVEDNAPVIMKTFIGGLVLGALMAGIYVMV